MHEGGTGSSGLNRQWHEFFSRYNLLICSNFPIVPTRSTTSVHEAPKPVIAYEARRICSSTAYGQSLRAHEPVRGKCLRTRPLTKAALTPDASQGSGLCAQMLFEHDFRRSKDACRVHMVEVVVPPASGHAGEEQIARFDRIHFP